MKIRTLLLGLAAILLLGLGLTGSAGAYSFNGALWTPADDAAKKPTPTMFAALGTPTATFTVEQIAFDSRGDDGANNTTDDHLTYNSFLSGALDNSNPNVLNWIDMATGFDPDSFYTARKKGTAFKFWGQARLGDKITITHDDGFYLILNGVAYDYHAPTTPKPTTLDNVAGVYDFELYYGAWNGFPEVLTIDGGFEPVPEPGTLLLFGAGLLGLALCRKKKCRS